MKKNILITSIILVTYCIVFAQPPGRQDQPRYTLPKEQIAKPQPIKLTPLTFEQMLDDASWKGIRTWNTNNSVTIDSITMLSFFLQYKQVSWSKQGWESVTPKPGSYTVTNYKVIIQFNYPPYTHYLEGVYDPVTKKITGMFKEERAVIANAPPAYQPGTTTGQFVLIQK